MKLRALYIVFGDTFHHDDVEQGCEVRAMSRQPSPFPSGNHCDDFAAEADNSSRSGIF
jgi:hypothetical protein